MVLILTFMILGTTLMPAFFTAMTNGEALASVLPDPFRSSGSLYGTRQPTIVKLTM